MLIQFDVQMRCLHCGEWLCFAGPNPESGKAVFIVCPCRTCIEKAQKGDKRDRAVRKVRHRASKQ